MGQRWGILLILTWSVWWWCLRFRGHFVGHTHWPVDSESDGRWWVRFGQPTKYTVVLMVMVVAVETNTSTSDQLAVTWPKMFSVVLVMVMMVVVVVVLLALVCA